ncbi:hypothetical protein A9P82_02900 [Arachidicoccus ginsenosidimutans]|uniref:DUF4959 domain-containing protein n=1 Tax=Arachidicoccus sp. BS20 TaxID=1850526 RepID=UPI0007F0BF81|nr:DUF5000 domain-containing lipoprotein [Arachidicoccus sp. BS20]ANI88335.1 hypothetical protein A9P82_02865 [Arachidicoccus sp. BS20]ANI88341.1 hypothetical protein A9P82_02900 [Arachidicoccus sp. BS20]
MNKYIPIILMLGTLIITGCKKDGAPGLIEDGTTPPGKVSNVKVTNKNGAASITYTPPSDPDLLYIKAVYSLTSGKEVTVKSSYYSNQIDVQGFNDTLVHEVKLYSVNRSELASDPVTVDIQPLVSPVQIAYRNMAVTATAGGVHITSLNPLRSDLVIVPLVDSLNDGKWEGLNNIYTADSAISVSIRGMPSVERKFGFYIRDRWANATDTLFATLTPKQEILLDKSKFFVFQCDNDSKFSYQTHLDLMWNNNPNLQQWPCVNTDISSSTPAVITWGLGDEPVKLTRFTLYTRQQNNTDNSPTFFADGSPKLFEVYGSNNPSHSGDWSEWTKILTCQVTKPSGLPLGQGTNADYLAGLAGFSFDFDEDTPPYRYLRIKNLQNWMGTYFIVIEQINMWGTND